MEKQHDYLLFNKARVRLYFSTSGINKLKELWLECKNEGIESKKMILQKRIIRQIGQHQGKILHIIANNRYVVNRCPCSVKPIRNLDTLHLLLKVAKKFHIQQFHHEIIPI
ncbi:hypothetical protein [Symbiopectobacterium sp. RP]|uniref:hypothetical protein n=1 Tax=Symbiopectobacterium sp. RP TaxID=3248553 RepID=UPI003D2BE3DA